MHGNVPVRFGRGRLDSLGNKGLAAYLIRAGPAVRAKDVLELHLEESTMIPTLTLALQGPMRSVGSRLSQDFLPDMSRQFVLGHRGQ